MSDAVERVRKILSARLVEIEKETRRLKRAADELSTRDGAKRRATKRRARWATSGRQGRGNGQQVARGHRREQVLAALKANPGSRPSELAANVGISATQVSGLLAKARADKLVAKKGTGYFLLD